MVNPIDRTTDDCISRQAAIDEINERQRKLIYCFGFDNDMVKIMDIAKAIISAIPSAQPDGWLERNKDEILKAGIEGREVEFRIGGRRFAIREKAQ